MFSASFITTDTEQPKLSQLFSESQRQVKLSTLQVNQGFRVLLRQAAQALKLTAPVGHSPAALPPASTS